MFRFGAAAFLFLLALFSPSGFPAQDSDRDGFPDEFERNLLEKFLPDFFVSARDCDGVPAEFAAGEPSPRLLDKNGTIYGMVTPAALTSRKEALVEIHYFHLWNSDCGLKPHAFDVEHVSVLTSAPDTSTAVSGWKAEYWYAAAHQDTACDSSHAVRGAVLSAEHSGPSVWISAGKHASYLSRDLCGRGCGTDDCSGAYMPLPVSKIVNLGEPGSPANGLAWIGWDGWPLDGKMRIANFTQPVAAKLDSAGPSIIPINQSRAEIKTAVHVSASTAEALIGADRSTDSAINSANKNIDTSLKGSARGTGRALRRAAKAVWSKLPLPGN